MYSHFISIVLLSLFNVRGQVLCTVNLQVIILCCNAGIKTKHSPTLIRSRYSGCLCPLSSVHSKPGQLTSNHRNITKVFLLKQRKLIQAFYKPYRIHHKGVLWKIDGSCFLAHCFPRRFLNKIYFFLFPETPSLPLPGLLWIFASLVFSILFPFSSQSLVALPVLAAGI